MARQEGSARSARRDDGLGTAWSSASPESEGIVSEALEELWDQLQQRQTRAWVVIRNDRLIFERYTEGWRRDRPHYTASLAKALVGGVSLMVAMNDERIRPDDLASRYVTAWTEDTRERGITVRHLATHTSGIEDAEEDGLPHDRLSGWKGEFWKRLPPPRDPFSLARDVAPVLDAPGTKARYSNPGMAMLAYCVTASLRGTEHEDLRSLLAARVMAPIGVPDGEWSCGYGAVSEIDEMRLVANWGGGSYSANAVARVGRLMLRQGSWGGKALLSPEVVASATTHAGMPNNAGLGWWVNRSADGTRPWSSAPADAFWGSGAGQQFLLVVPSLDLIVVRFGETMDTELSHQAGLERHLVAPLMAAFVETPGAPYPKSRVIRSVRWAPAATIVRHAFDSDCWPLTWGDDDALYTAYGDGYGFDPRVPEKLSLGFARVTGPPGEFTGANIRSATGEAKGDGARGRKASGILMVGGVLYLWVRNAGNAQLGWSTDRMVTWRWADWKLTESFGCPTFLNFGRHYEGARDGFIYLYSHDSDSAYVPADRMLLARVPKERVRDRDAYTFFEGLDRSGQPAWTKEIGRRGAVFTHPGRCYRSGVTFNAGLRRYLWCQTLPGGDTRFRGGFGIYDAPEPWGPWTTVFFTEEWDVGPGETSSFPAKWMSADGRSLHLVFSGDDWFSVRQVALEVGAT
jgi:CubicO group peptidase (beta-lactamase class C family)